MPERVEEGVPVEAREALPAPQNLPTKKEEKRKIVIVEASHAVESQARDVADAKMTESREYATMFRRIWRHNLWREYFSHKEYRKAKSDILESGNIFAGQTLDNAAHEATMGAIVDRFAKDADEDTIHAGEIKDKLGESEEEKVIRSGVQRIVKEYASGAINDEVFMNERSRLFNQLKEGRGDVFDKGLMYADNLFTIAKEARQNVEHGRALEALDLDFQFVIGKAKTGARTEAQFTAVDRLTEKIVKSPVGKFVNEATVASALSIATVVLGRTAQSGGGRVAAWLTFGGSALLAGGVAGMRESKRLEEERRQHARETAVGKTFDPDTAPRRTEMEQYRYETKKATDLALALQTALYEADGKTAKTLDTDKLRAVIESLADIESRIKLSDQRNIDLVSYSDVTKVEKERLDLDLFRAQAKADLKLAAERNPGLLRRFGSMADMINARTALWVEEQLFGETGLEQKNELFKKMKHRKVAGAVCKGILVGVGVGLVAQEGLALAGKSQFGLAGWIFGKNESNVPTMHLTSLEYMRRYFAGSLPKTSPSEFVDGTFNGIAAKFPKGFDVLKNPDGTLTLFDAAHQSVADHITLNPDGTLSQEAIRMLGDKGVVASSAVEQIVGTKKVPTSEDAQSIIEKYKGLTKRIYRTLWYDNDTPKPVFDKNELRLLWGAHGIGIDKNGNYVFDMSKMRSDGSYHKEFSADAQKLIADGKLKILLSLSRGTQSQVFEVPIGTNGQALIDPNSEIGKTLFQIENGHAKFLGRFAEVAESVGAKDDVERVRILATYEGKGIDGVPGTKDVLDVIPRPKYFFDQPQNYVVDPPPVIPILGRRPLEPTNEWSPYLMPSYLREGGETAKLYKERQSKTLENNPDAKLDHYKEIEDYFSRQPKEWVEKVKELAGTVEPMDKKCQISFIIPAAGHQERKNIYKTLSLYKGQEKPSGEQIDLREYEVVVFVNHPIDRNPDKTLEEVQRFKSENPEVNIRVVYKALPRNEAKIGTIRKYANDVALWRHHQRGESAKDLILVSNDADAKDMSPKYVETILSKFHGKKNDHVDAVLGKVDWEPDAYLKSPLLHVGTRFFQYLDTVWRHHKEGVKRAMGSCGPNTAFRSSIFAAVGGYLEDDTVAEDMHLGNMIKYARQGRSKYPFAFGGPNSLIVTNARRGLQAIEAGLAPAEQWAAFGPDDAIREKDWVLDANDAGKWLEDPDRQEKLRIHLERYVNRTLRVYGLGANAWETKRAIGFLGAKYRIENGQVKITDISKVLAGLRRYRSQQVVERAFRKIRAVNTL